MEKAQKLLDIFMIMIEQVLFRYLKFDLKVKRTWRMSVTYPEFFWAYRYLQSKWSWRDYNTFSSSILKC